MVYYHKDNNFVQLGVVDNTNLRARRIMHKMFNKINKHDMLESAQECVVSGLSYLFSSEEFADGTLLEQFKVTGKRRCMR